MTPLETTPLHSLHERAGARMAEFAGYDMPIRYEAGIIAEHLHTRRAAGLFDVSHMGVVEIHGPDRAVWLESVLPADIVNLSEGRMRYSFLTNEHGGIIDDLMVTKTADHLALVLNAGRKAADLAHLERMRSGSVTLEPRPDLALLALQGPAAATVLDRLIPGVGSLSFMTAQTFRFGSAGLGVSRSGYTGEDGYEITVGADEAASLAEALLADDAVEWAGLGARDTLRLEAGLCLYGHDLDESTTPVEAGLTWAIQKRRRLEGGFPGAEVIVRQLANGPDRRRVGLQPEGRAPVREGAPLASSDGADVGAVTSGGFGPSVQRPVAMGYVASAHDEPGSELVATVRGKPVPIRIVDLPFVPHRYHR